MGQLSSLQAGSVATVALLSQAVLGTTTLYAKVGLKHCPICIYVETEIEVFLIRFSVLPLPIVDNIYLSMNEISPFP